MINFSEVEKSVRDLKQRLAAGKIDEKTLEEQLLEMIDLAEDGHYWMFGHQSENWFRHNGSKWVKADPNQRFRKVTTPTPQAVAAIGPERSDLNGGNSHQPDDKAIDLGWFIISLILLALIGGIIYYATLIA